MKFDFNINESSTIRGIIWIFGGLSALIAIFTDSIEKGTAIMGITATVAGALGVGLTDKDK